MLHFAQMKAGDQTFKQANEMEPRNEHAHHWHAARTDHGADAGEGV